MNRYKNCAVFLWLIVVASYASATELKLDLCDVTWLWPAPQTEKDLEGTITISDLKTEDDLPVWTDQQFEDVLKAADGDFASVQKSRIKLPTSVRDKKVWRIVAFRVDPTAPGGHEAIRHNLGEQPQVRLVLQPVSVANGKVKVHDIAIHMVYSFLLKEGTVQAPDRQRFQLIVKDLQELKRFLSENQINTDGVPLGIHPGLKSKSLDVKEKLRTFFAKHLHPERLSAMALMGLDDPEPWIFVALGRTPPDNRFGPVPFLPAQMLSRRTGKFEVLPTPKTNNRNSVLSKFIMPMEGQDRRGVSTDILFKAGLEPKALAAIGIDVEGRQVKDEKLKNEDIADYIANPTTAHFFNTDCLSCHTETRRRIALRLGPGDFAYKHNGEVPQIAQECLPKDDWNVRNLGWFQRPDSVATVTQRTANETAEVVEFIHNHYGRNFKAVDPKAVPDNTISEFGKDVRYLDQGWSDEDRQQFYFVGQGSQLIPYDWFLHLESAGSQSLFRDAKHMRSLGFIPQEPSRPRNIDGLPIGIVKDSNPATIAVKRSLVGKKFDLAKMPATNDWLGLTCAACHTSELRFKGKAVRIDGGAAMADVETFLSDLSTAIRETADDDDKYARFETKFRAANASADVTTLRGELLAFAPVLEDLVARNKADHPYGLGRLDAFGAILNQVCAAGLDIPANRRPSSAPVSYPFLWYTPELDWVQWNSSVDNPIARNVGEVLGVFGHAKLTGTPQTGQFGSSVLVDRLHRLEATVATLKSPRWPEELFGKLDKAAIARGKVLFQKNCAHCHNDRNEAGEFERTAENDFGKSFIKTTSVFFAEIGTDPQMVMNFVTRMAEPGDLQPYLRAQLESEDWKIQQSKLESFFEKLGQPKPDFTKQVPAGMLLKAAVSGVTKRYLEEAFVNRSPEEKTAMTVELSGFRTTKFTPNFGAGYKARPLSGIWATAPYGHAGAVPNLYQWLSPENERVVSFNVGFLEFDPVHVGFAKEGQTGGFRFDTLKDNAPIPGNSNRGHSGPGFTNFTHDERMDIIEYLKGLQ